MTDFVKTAIRGSTGIITLDRPSALNSLNLEMVRALTRTLMEWREQPAVRAVLVKGSTGRAYCAGGDIRFFYHHGKATATAGSALIEDFFNEEYALNHLVHHYPKPYLALLDGVVMGGGMGIAQAGPRAALRVVTEHSKMAMPEVGIGLFPDVGGSYFLSRTPGQIGTYLGLTGDTIGAADTLYAGLADTFLPSAQLAALESTVQAAPDARAAALGFALAYADQAPTSGGRLAQERTSIDRHFGHHSVPAIMDSLASDSSPFAMATLSTMQKRSPLMMSVTLQQLRLGAQLGFADCLRMERNLVRRCFEHGEVLEGVRALAIDKDHAPQWKPATLEEVTPAMVEAFFSPAWPDYAHPLRDLS